MTVFYGMLGVTLFGLFFTPVFYFVVRRLVEWRSTRRDSVESDTSSVAAL